MVARETDNWDPRRARLPLYPRGVGLYKPPGAPMQRVQTLRPQTRYTEGRELALPPPSSRTQLEEQPCTPITIVIMRRPRRAAVGVLSPRRALKLGKIRRRACLRIIPLPGTGDVLLAPTMISHPLAYVVSNPRHLAPTVGRGAPSSRDLFWTGTLFLPGERSQPGTPEGVCADTLHGAETVCAASKSA